jgi:hypothetical protein
MEALLRLCLNSDDSRSARYKRIFSLSWVAAKNQQVELRSMREREEGLHTERTVRWAALAQPHGWAGLHFRYQPDHIEACQKVRRSSHPQPVIESMNRTSQHQSSSEGMLLHGALCPTYSSADASGSN